MDVDLFDDGGASMPRPARDIIDAARRRLDAAEVRLMFETPLSVFVHHGEVFAAGRWSDALLQAVADLPVPRYEVTALRRLPGRVTTGVDTGPVAMPVLTAPSLAPVIPTGAAQHVVTAQPTSQTIDTTGQIPQQPVVIAATLAATTLESVVPIPIVSHTPWRDSLDAELAAHGGDVVVADEPAATVTPAPEPPRLTTRNPRWPAVPSTPLLPTHTDPTPVEVVRAILDETPLDVARAVIDSADHLDRHHDDAARAIAAEVEAAVRRALHQHAD
ncbi:MAG: hypothetical protein ACO3C1_11745 [Ilumatobacteraceae bacterium]